MEVELLGKHLGAKIHGLDLSRELTDTQFADVHRAFLDHLVLLFPDQPLEPRQFMRFGQRFGALEPPHPLLPSHPDESQVTIIFSDAEHPPENDVWHSDVTWRRTPPLGTALHAQVLPPSGGDTMWASMYAVYDALSVEEKARFERLHAVHSIGTFAGANQDSEDGSRVEEALAKYPPVEHPMIRTHPETGRQAMFVNEGFTTHIADVDDAESHRILGSIWEMVSRPEFQVRIQWSPNTVAVWDNRCTQHQAAADYYPEFRKMHRVTFIGDEPRLVLNS